MEELNFMYVPISIKRKTTIIYQDLIAFAILITIFSMFSFGFKEINKQISEASNFSINLEWFNLFEYSLRTGLRMFIAIILSGIFSIIYAKIAFSSRYLEKILIALLDILQSIPIFGYIAFTVSWFMGLFPGKIIGMELAVIFAIFTSQVWNMTFSVYQSLKTSPSDLTEVSSMMKLTNIEKFFRLELPYALPGLIWNSMISMAGGWFFIVASEAISIGDIEFSLPGIGSYIAKAIEQENIYALIYALISMFIIINIYNFFIFKPLVVWSNKFKLENYQVSNISKSWFLEVLRKSRFTISLSKCFSKVYDKVVKIIYKKSTKKNIETKSISNIYSYIFTCSIAIFSLFKFSNFIITYINIDQILELLRLSIYSMIRVIILIIASIIVWTPIGVYIGFRPKLSMKIQTIIQFLAALPVNLFFPLVVIVIVKYKLNPNIWLSILMIIGSQWYILFNVIAASSVFSNDLKEVINNFRIRKIDQWFKIILPAIFPYIVTGSITATGAAWNATIIAEVANWGDITLKAEGIGRYISDATLAGDSPKIIMGISSITIFIVAFNKILWRPLYKFTEKYTKF